MFVAIAEFGELEEIFHTSQSSQDIDVLDRLESLDLIQFSSLHLPQTFVQVLETKPVMTRRTGSTYMVVPENETIEYMHAS